MDGMRYLAIAIGLLVLSMSPAFAQDSDSESTQDEQTGELPEKPQPVQMPRSELTAPEWYQQANSDEIDALLTFDAADVAGRGDDAAVVFHHERYWLVHRRDGALGMVAAPDDTTWIGLSAEDEVYAATASGRLYVARNPDAALKEDGFRNIMNIDGALHWEVTPEVVVAVTSEELARVDPATAALTRTPLPGEGAPAGIHGRADGVLVLQRGEGDALRTWISLDLGESWQESETQPGLLMRIGQRIEESRRKKVRVSLASDGSTWISSVPTEPYPDWDALGKLQTEPRSHTSSPTTSHLQPAAYPPDGPGNMTSRMIGYGGMGFSGEPPCEGFECLGRAPAPEGLPGPYLYAFFTDGLCQDENDNSVCDPDESLTRLPRLARFSRDNQKLEFITIPDGCIPLAVRDAAGLGVLYCDGEDGVKLWVRGPDDDDWKAESTLSPPATQMALSASDDGTIFATPTRCASDGCGTAWVRRPAAPGEGSWEQLPENAVAFRSAGDGRIVTINAAGELAVLDPDGDELANATLPARGDLLNVGLEPGGCIRTVYGAAAQSRDEETEVQGSGLVTTDGNLLEGVECGTAVEEWETSQRQGLFQATCPTGARVNVIRSDEVGVASLNCPAELPLDPGVYQVVVNKEDHQTVKDEIVVDSRQLVSRDYNLFAIPTGTISAVGGGFFSGDEVGIGGQLRATFGISVFEGEYDVGGLFRMAFAEEGFGFLGAFFANYVLHVTDYLDFRFGGGLGLGSMRGQADEEGLSAASAITMRYIFTVGMNVRLWGPLSLRVYTDAYLTPFVFDAGAGLAVSF